MAKYKPLFTLFFYITLVSLLVTYVSLGDFTKFMQVFMAGFFLSFSYFKLINLREFAHTYAMYDVVAKKIFSWGYIYPFIELLLGVLYVLNIFPRETNILTIVVMGVSSIGVIQSVLNKREIKCACLGAVFNLPMSTITIIEDLLMVIMAALMLVI